MSSPVPTVPSGEELKTTGPSKPPPEPEKSEERQDSGAPAGSGDSSAGSAAATPPPPPSAPTTAIFNNSIQIDLTAQREALLPGAGERVSVFSWRLGVPIGRGDEISLASLFTYNPEFVDQTLSSLLQGRVILLVGEPDKGKEATARYLASRIRDAIELERDTLLFAPLASDLLVSIHFTVASNKELQSRVLIFRDLLDRGNLGLREFLGLLKDDGATNVARTLERVNSYLILTSSPEALVRERVTQIPARIRRQVPALTPDELRHGVERRISAFQKLHGTTAGQEVAPGLIDEICSRAGAMSRAVRFIDAHLAAVLRGDKTLQQAFDEQNALSTWFHENADSDREAWIYALALTLATPLGRDDDVPWSEFCVIYDEVRLHVLKWRRSEAPERPLDEERLQRTAGAETRRHWILPRDLIAFREPDTARRLWDVLLSSFRPLVNSLVPTLLRLTEHDNVAVRSRAAQALGRIGRLDAATLSGVWLQQWADSGPYRQRALAGYLVQAAFCTGDAEYRQYALNALERFAKDRGRVWTAIAAYKQVGVLDLTLALSRLKEIAERHLAPAFETSQAVGRRIDQLDRNLASFRSVEANILKQVLGELRRFYLESFEKDAEIATCFTYSLVSLAMTCGLAPILGTLSRWSLGAPGMEALVCLVFLQDGGIASELTNCKVSIGMDEESNELVTCNLILASMIDDPQRVQTLTRFLETMYAGLLDFFPPDAAVLLTHSILEHLKTWIEEALPIPRCRTAMVETVGRLLRSNLRELYERTYDWLSSDPDFRSGEMAVFVRDARRFAARSNQG